MDGEEGYTGEMTDLGPYSPVTLNGEWSKLGRLSLVTFLSIFGTTMNGFFVASFFVNKVFMTAGNVFLCALGLADMIITTVDMPICVVVLISGQWDSLDVCKFLQFMTEASTYSYSLLAVMVALESYIRICCSEEAYEIFMSIPRELVMFIICSLSFGISYIGVYYRQDYDYCERKHHGNIYFRRSVDLFFYAIPGVITLLTLIITSIGVRRKSRSQVQYRRSRQYQTDCSLTNLNILNYGLFIFSWIPYLALVYNDPNATSPLYYNFVWFALMRSVITTFMYGIINRNFRKSFSQIFNYCCCKNNLPSSLNSRHRRVGEYKPGEVRVHMMQQMVASGLSQRNIGSSLYETSEL